MKFPRHEKRSLRVFSPAHMWEKLKRVLKSFLSFRLLANKNRELKLTGVSSPLNERMRKLVKMYIPEMIIQYEIIVIQRLFKLFISIFMDSPLHHKSFRRELKFIK